MGKIQIFAGKGHGKSPAALGEAVMAAAAGKHVVIIQFLKGKGLIESELERRLEPELKIFRFEKSAGDFNSWPEEKRKEEARNIRNGIAFARKVLMTGECDLLVLDEPFKGLDETLRENMMALVSKTNAAILLVTHDEEEAAALGCEIIRM